MAPEVFRAGGSSCYSAVADMFSFGVVMYQMIAFEMPWGPKGLTFMDYDIKIKNPLTFPKRVADDSQFQPFIDMCRRCLSENPSGRPTSKALKTELAELN